MGLSKHNPERLVQILHLSYTAFDYMILGHTLGRLHAGI